MIISGAQCRIARGLLGWSLSTLAVRCRIGETTIRNFEIGGRLPTPIKIMEIKRIHEEAGVEFTPESARIRR